MPRLLRSLVSAVRRVVDQGRRLKIGDRLRRVRERLFGPAEGADRTPGADSADHARHTAGRDSDPDTDTRGTATAQPSKPSKPPQPVRPTRRSIRFVQVGPPRPEAFVKGSFRHGRMVRDYRLYCPPAPFAEPAALVVMLHGCKQNPEDFAAGTRTNEWAREEGFFVLYPAQSALANPARCWNWYSPDNLQPGRGEAGLIMALVDELLSTYPLDPERVFVAGLSAGGAMAAHLVRTYPNRFAGAGIHSGVPAGVAHDVISALAAMRGRYARRPPPRPPTPDAIDADSARTNTWPGVPTIVFHGDEDKVASPTNADRIIADTLSSFANDAELAAVTTASHPDAPSDRSGTDASLTASGNLPPARVDEGQLPGGCSWTRTRQEDGSGRPLAEHWALHGFGHAWSGGSPEGSYTDEKGPDATREMLRFFRAASSRRRGSMLARLGLGGTEGGSRGWRAISRG